MRFVLSARGSRALSRTLLASAAICCASAAQASVSISDKPTSNMSCAGGVCSPTAAKANLNVTDLANSLAAGDIKIVSDSAAKDIEFKAPLSWTSTSRLTLDSYRSIIFQQPITVTGTGAATVDSRQGDLDGTITYVKKGRITFWDLSSKLMIDGLNYKLVNSVSMLARAIAKKSSGNYALANNYDAAADGKYRKSPIAEFHGFAEGLGNAISHLTIDDRTPGNNVGLFATTAQLSRVYNFRLVNAHVSAAGGGARAGALIGQTTGFLQGDSVSGSVKTGDDSYVGGLVGDQDDPGKISFCESSATISGGNSMHAGGIAGKGYEIDNSAASGNVTIIDGEAGGLVGDLAYLSTYSRATGNVVSTGDGGGIGGLAGNAYEIDYSYATGAVSGADGSAAGGLAGSSITTRASFATGAVNVTGSNGIVGGLLGQDIGLTWNSYAAGTVNSGSNDDEVGGLIGLYWGGAQIYASYAVGSVAGGNNVGGVAGFAENGAEDMTAAYWDLETSGISDPHQAVGNVGDYPGATGLTSEQFKSGLPDGLDPKVWGQSPNINDGYPYLLANPPPKK
ncbi:MAG TPA: hypothetical protein VHU18_02550 [Rhizomicrobium sp.]|jgi:hypothetical protein|nr:hypothetical protein [Rhizomicrobium sp.]